MSSTKLSHCIWIKTKLTKTSHSSTGGRRICRRGCGTCVAYQLLELGPDSKEGNRRSHLPFHFQPALLPLHTFFFFENFAMASGVKLSDGVKHAYDDIKKHSKYLYAIFIIKVFSAFYIKLAKKTYYVYLQDGEIVVEKYGEKDKGNYESFLKDLAVKDENGKDACRFDA